MLRILLTSAGAAALVFTAAAASQAQEKTDAPKYKPVEAAAEPIKAIEVTTRDDAAKLAAAQFTLADADANGAVDANEFAAFVKTLAKSDPGVPTEKAQPAEAAFAAIAKTDKLISKDELVEARAKSFDAADADRSKSLDPLEQQRFAALVAAKPEGAATPK